MASWRVRSEDSVRADRRTAAGCHQPKGAYFRSALLGLPLLLLVVLATRKVTPNRKCGRCTTAEFWDLSFSSTCRTVAVTDLARRAAESQSCSYPDQLDISVENELNMRYPHVFFCVSVIVITHVFVFNVFRSRVYCAITDSAQWEKADGATLTTQALYTAV